MDTDQTLTIESKLSFYIELYFINEWTQNFTKRFDVRIIPSPSSPDDRSPNPDIQN